MREISWGRERSRESVTGNRERESARWRKKLSVGSAVWKKEMNEETQEKRGGGGKMER